MRPEIARTVLGIAYGVYPLTDAQRDEADRRAERVVAALVSKIYREETEHRELEVIDLGGEA